MEDREHKYPHELEVGAPKGRYPRPEFPSGRAVSDAEAQRRGFESAEDWYVQDKAPEGGLPRERAVLRADYQLAKSSYSSSVADTARIAGTIQSLPQSSAGAPAQNNSVRENSKLDSLTDLDDELEAHPVEGGEKVVVLTAETKKAASARKKKRVADGPSGQSAPKGQAELQGLPARGLLPSRASTGQEGRTGLS